MAARIDYYRPIMAVHPRFIVRRLRSRGVAALSAAAGLALAIAAAATSCPPTPQAANLNGHPPVYLYRDIESCRIFTPRYDPARSMPGP